MFITTAMEEVDGEYMTLSNGHFVPRFGKLRRLFEIRRRMDQDLMEREARITKNTKNVDRVALAVSRPLVSIG